MDKSDIINAIPPLPAGSMERMAACMEEVAYAKGTRILRAGKTERNVFFIKKGIVRAFVSTQGREITFWLGAEGTPVVSIKATSAGCRATRALSASKTRCSTCCAMPR